MGNVIRPVFTNGERLTAQRLNEIVEYLRTSLRRALLAPLSPGVAAGFELGGTKAADQSGFEITALAGFAAPTQMQSVAAVAVGPGVAIDGVARILVSTQGLRFTYLDIVAQIPDLAAGDRVLVSVGADGGAANSGPGANPLPLEPRVAEGVKLFFSRLSALEQGALVSPAVSAAIPSPSVRPWADPIDQSGSANSFAVPLGSVVYQQDGNTLTPSLAQRAGVMPMVGALRNSFGDTSLLLDRAPDGVAAMGVTVPTVFWPTAPAFFTSTAGGPRMQAAVVAVDVGRPPAGRANAIANAVFEVAGGNEAEGVATLKAGTSGVVAVSIKYDATANGFPTLTQQSGFPLVLSSSSSASATGQPMAAPPPQNAINASYIGLSAAPSSQAEGTVAVATAGIIMAYVLVAAGSTILPVGTLLYPALTPTPENPQRWGLVTLGGGATVVAQLAAPLSNSGQKGVYQAAWVWVVPPIPIAPPPTAFPIH